MYGLPRFSSEYFKFWGLLLLIVDRFLSICKLVRKFHFNMMIVVTMVAGDNHSIVMLFNKMVEIDIKN